MTLIKLAASALALVAPGTTASAAPAGRDASSVPVGVSKAARSAVREPSASGFVNAVQVYAFVQGGLYRLYTAPGRVSDIALEPGEALVAVAAGDTARWVIGDTTSGSGATRRTHVLVKPVAAGLHTNLVISTDRRVYLLDLKSSSGTSMTGVSWTYPEDELLALKRKDEELRGTEAVAPIALDRLDFGYRIEGARPRWRPLRAFDDGRQVFIEFPLGLASIEAPPLFVIGSTGRAELVNYRLRGRYYVVDRLFSTAELRLGERKQAVVRIIRTGSKASRRSS